MPSQHRVPLRPRVVGGGGGGRGNSLSAMRERIEAAKANDSDVDAKLRDFTAFAGRQKQKTKLQAHQLDWRQEHGRLTRERAELESGRHQWLQAAAAGAVTKRGEAAKAPADERQVAAELRSVQDAELAADGARREWSLEMREQLRGLRELCEAAGELQHERTAFELVADMRDGLQQQAERLDAAALTLQHEVAALAASALRESPDDDAAISPDLAGDEAEGAAAAPPPRADDGARIAALSGAFVAPEGLRSEGQGGG